MLCIWHFFGVLCSCSSPRSRQLCTRQLACQPRDNSSLPLQHTASRYFAIAAGEHYSLADIAASPYLALLPAAGASNLIDSRPAVKAWADRILK